MKKMLIVGLMTCGLTAAMAASNVKEGTTFLGDNVKADVRAFYFNRGFDGTAPRTMANTVGGVINYETNKYEGLSFGASYFGSYKVGEWFSREQGTGTSILGREGEDLSMLGEAYISYTSENFDVKVGRQRLTTPLANDHDLRMLPSSYEAAIATYKPVNGTSVQAGYIRGYTGFTSKENQFLDFDEKWGKDGLAYVTGKTSIGDLTMNGQYVQVCNDTDDTGATIAVHNYWYGDANYNLTDLGTKTFVKAQVGGNMYNESKDSLMYGAKIGTTFSIVDVAAVGNVIRNNSFKAVESGPMFTDWQQGYGNYEASDAYGGYINLHFTNNWYLKGGMVDVTATEGNARDSFYEYNADTAYSFNNANKLRIRYSLKDQKSGSTREDRDDIRVIYYLSF